MIGTFNSPMWYPVESHGWSRRAYGKTVVYESEGGTLRAALGSQQGNMQLYLNMVITGRMLIEAWCNGSILMSDTVSNDEFDRFVDLPASTMGDPLIIELHLIPATFGEVRIARSIALAVNPREAGLNRPQILALTKMINSQDA